MISKQARSVQHPCYCQSVFAVSLCGFACKTWSHVVGCGCETSRSCSTSREWEWRGQQRSGLGMLAEKCWFVYAGIYMPAVFINQSTYLGFNALNYILNIVSVRFCLKLQMSVMQKGCEEEMTKFSRELCCNAPIVCCRRGRWLLAANQIINILFIPVALIFFPKLSTAFSVYSGKV